MAVLIEIGDGEKSRRPCRAVHAQEQGRLERAVSVSQKDLDADQSAEHTRGQIRVPVLVEIPGGDTKRNAAGSHGRPDQESAVTAGTVFAMKETVGAACAGRLTEVIARNESKGKMRVGMNVVRIALADTRVKRRRAKSGLFRPG